jgi:hypothetical protein
MTGLGGAYLDSERWEQQTLIIRFQSGKLPMTEAFSLRASHFSESRRITEFPMIPLGRVNLPTRKQVSGWKFFLQAHAKCYDAPKPAFDACSRPDSAERDLSFPT